MKALHFVLAVALLTTPIAGGTETPTAQGLAGAAQPRVEGGKRPIAVDDIFNIRELRDPQRSPDGKWVAYTVASAIKDTDKNNTDVWMVSWDGSQQIQITSSPDGESSPRWSPDNKYLSFVSSRQGAKAGQVWILNRAGGEAVKITDVKGGVSDHAWSPDSKRLVLVAEDPDPADKDADQPPGEKKTPKPIVIDRYRFKADVEGFLRNQRSHLYLFDVEAKKAEILTPGSFEESSPSWSPDGRQIAFIRVHGEGDVDKMPNNDLFVIEAKPGAQPRRLTTTTAEESGRPAWSPDGRQIAYLLGDEVKYSAYDQSRLAVISAAGGEPRVLTAALDRPVSSAFWSPDGANLFFTITDDRAVQVGKVASAGGNVQRVTEGRRVVSNLSPGPDGAYALLASTATEHPEVHALESGKLRKLTHQNDEWMKGVLTGTTEDFTSTSKDGTVVNSLVVKPPTFDPSRKYPVLLRIHGGPNGQDQHSFNYEREVFAANGYVVISVNYRGSNGRGSAFQKAIFADWGNKEVVDLLGAMDALQKQPWVDPSRLGIGGWSYGGILTNYTIAQDTRFKAAISGAGSSNQISMYGSDMYITQYEQEIGPPWKSQDLWIKISYPFFKADRIKTPTLFLVGQNDFNVPLAGSEQMYQALRSLGVETQLIIYPNQFHGITVPSYRIDRMQRYLDWYGKYLKAATTPTASR
jgi:dipeptidyl aminopeptidase/acylaminoacyl peptidase